MNTEETVRKILREIADNTSGATITVDNVGLKNATDVRINPSTEEKQDATNTKLDTLISGQLPAGHTVEVNNLPTEYPLPAAQVFTLTPPAAITGFATETTLAKMIGFEIGAYDYIALTYVSAGNGAGEIETVVYKTGGSAGTITATLTLAYDANNNITSITKT